MSARKSHQDQRVTLESNKKVKFKEDQTGGEDEPEDEQARREINMPKRRKGGPTQTDRDKGARIAAESERHQVYQRAVEEERRLEEDAEKRDSPETGGGSGSSHGTN